MTAVTTLDVSLDDLDVEEPDKPRPLANSLVAAATRLNKTELKRIGHQAKSEGWQEDAWDMFDLVGEERFLASTLANRMGQARFFAGKLPDKATDDVEEETAGPAYDVFSTMAGNGYHLKPLVQRLGLNLFVPGDGYLLGIPKGLEASDPDQTLPKKLSTALQRISPFGAPEEEHDALADIDLETLEWGMYSISELSIDDKNGKITVSRDSKKAYSADDVVLIRVWRPHPRVYQNADSPTRSSLPVLRELVGLTMHISAQVDSRLAGAGILFVPASADAAMRAAAGATGAEDLSPFAEGLMEAMVTPIGDRSNASAIVPLMPVVPDDTIEKFRHMSFAGPLDKEARALRDEAIRRLALGQDCPPELLLGTGGMNHWGAWLVRDDVVTTHLEPPLALICDAITTQFLWPVLQLQGIEDYKQYVIWYDVSHLISRPNRSTEAKEAHAAGVIKDATYRDAVGFDETDAPEVKVVDPVIELVLQMVRNAPSLANQPGLSILAEQVRALLEGKVVEAPAAEAPAEGDDAAGAAPDETGDTEGGIPATSEDDAAPDESA